MNTEPDPTEDMRRARLAAIHGTIESQDRDSERQRLEAQYGQVWDSSQLWANFEALGFMAPFVMVRRRSDGRKGSLEFQHHPRFYFNFVLDHHWLHFMQNQDGGFWGEPIFSYSRAQAIADGVLVDLTDASDHSGQLLCPQAGFRVPVAITRAAWAKTIEAGGKSEGDGEVLELKGGQSLTARLCYLLSTLRVACRRAGDTDRIHFSVLLDVNGDGRHETVKLWALCGPGDDAAPALTVMLLDED